MCAITTSEDSPSEHIRSTQSAVIRDDLGPKLARLNMAEYFPDRDAPSAGLLHILSLPPELRDRI